MTTYDDRIAAFHDLHATGCFVMPNPWDIGSARVLEQLGFPALATTSAGAAWTLGLADNELSLEQALDHLRAIAGAVQIP
ncbi:isocitrate lyase/phosphoenolpyruvate mutase family protein, partial [Nocardioides sp. GCM10030258]|uniref:isocitrate lyase/phosphoenolpyruvate mutase family protein n=1 Tax=unclassified Nocardioides TaxID=2615069 RepID=UPI00361E7617